jgi:nitrogen fixation/metabolism regulation signal transduction histidine kinase
MEWKWTKGEPYERSRRIFKEQEEKDTEKFNREIEKSAYSSALNHDENTWDILNQTLSGNGFKISNKREELDTKMADRDLVQQRGNNPFLSETNYVNDVSIRDQFLKPINTAGEKVKNNSDSAK